MTRIDLSVADTLAQIARLRAEFPEIDEDADLLQGMIEGSTDLDKTASAILRIKREADIQVTGIKEILSDLSARKSRNERKSEACRTLLARLMTAAGATKLTIPEATISLSPGQEKAGITDLTELGQGFYREETVRHPLPYEILTALQAGEKIPGAELLPAKPYVTVRGK